MMRDYPKNSKTKRRRIDRTANPFLTSMKVIMLLLTAVYPLVMVSLSGAGLVYNSGSYGAEITRIGVLLIVSSVLMTAGAVLCIFRRSACSILSAVFSLFGCILCMVMLHKLVYHADASGWSNKFDMTPISGMYKRRIIPTLLPAAMCTVIAFVQFFSYDEQEERRERRKRRIERENADAPKIIGDE